MTFGSYAGVLAIAAKGISEAWSEYVINPVLNMGLLDILDILVITAVLYSVYLFVIGRRAGKLAVGLAMVLFIYAFGNFIELQAFSLIFSEASTFALTVLIVIFQPELRDALEKIGNTPSGLFFSGNREKAAGAHTVYEVVDAVAQIAQRERDGAIIVIERSTKLGDFAERGNLLDAEVSSKLLSTIFVDKTPLHDGAVIIRGERILSAGCKLPLSSNSSDPVLANLGTRHRAAVGVTEVSDCVVVVVSEETHKISVANNGQLKRDYNRTAADFKDAETEKDIKKRLREDLFMLIGGGDLQDMERALSWSEDQKEKAKKKENRRNVRLMKRGTVGNNKDDEEPKNNG